MNRRKVLSGIVSLGGIIAAGGFAEVAKAGTQGKMERFAQQGGDFSWKPHMLDPSQVATLAHAAYHHKGYG